MERKYKLISDYLSNYKNIDKHCAIESKKKFLSEEGEYLIIDYYVVPHFLEKGQKKTSKLLEKQFGNVYNSNINALRFILEDMKISLSKILGENVSKIRYKNAREITYNGFISTDEIIGQKIINYILDRNHTDLANIYPTIKESQTQQLFLTHNIKPIPSEKLYKMIEDNTTEYSPTLNNSWFRKGYIWLH